MERVNYLLALMVFICIVFSCGKTRDTEIPKTKNSESKDIGNVIETNPRIDSLKEQEIKRTIKENPKRNITKVGNSRDVNNFPEEYEEQTIIFKNIKYWPTLVRRNDYYLVQISISNNTDESEWGFTSLSTIIGVVEKEIAKKMSKDNVGGYKKFYYGTVTGKVIKSDEIFGSDYLFVIKKIINHPPGEPSDIRAIYESK